ncbi:C40 family peptidase [Candidatus Blastococcus massiliensis]|uniref:C40 family peptidase n=1 Tax=Candidatus Blastococcus massiliensis TaxID=1470358 RepID=UPI0004B1D8B9|nr:C40 family peptidase [Candidatus Blastococcus massiliensis]
MATTHPTQSRTVRRTGAALLTTAAASVGMFLTPATAVAADPAPAPAAASAPAPAPAQVAVDTARAQVGKAYQYGAAGPDRFDCSGLTQYSYRAAGIELPHSSKAQSEMGVTVHPYEMQPGDLVFFYSPVSHVGIYIGDSKMVHAGSESTGVEIADVGMPGFTVAKRIA